MDIIEKTIQKRSLIRLTGDRDWLKLANYLDLNKLPFSYRMINIFGNAIPNKHCESNIQKVLPNNFRELHWLEIHSSNSLSSGTIKNPEPQACENTLLALEICRNLELFCCKTTYGVKIIGYEHN
jgi:hypothetical protein